MIVQPDTTVKLANSEAVSLELGVDSSLAEVRLLPRFGEERLLPLSDARRFDFPAFASPNTVRVEWLDRPGSREAAFVSYVSVVSRHYFPLSMLRKLDSDQDGFDDAEAYPDDMLRDARQAATDVFEQAARRSFVRRVGRTKDYGRSKTLQLEHGDVCEILTPGYVQASDSVVEAAPGNAEPFPRWVEYLYGTEEMPAEVSRSVLELAAYMLRPTNRPVGATGESTDAGYIHFTTAGRDGATSIPEVNAAIEQFGRGPVYAW